MKYRAFILVAVICLMSCCHVYAAEPDHVYITGEVKDGLYTNRTLGAEAYFGENWKVLSREEIISLMGATASLSPTIE